MCSFTGSSIAAGSGVLTTVEVEGDACITDLVVSDINADTLEAEIDGYTSTKHQREAGTSYFDAVSQALTQGKSSTIAMEGSTEKDQF